MSGDAVKSQARRNYCVKKSDWTCLACAAVCGQSILQSFHHGPQSLPSTPSFMISSPPSAPLSSIPWIPTTRKSRAELWEPRDVCVPCSVRRVGSASAGLGLPHQAPRTCIEGRHNAAAAAARLVIQSRDQTSGTPPPCRARLTTSPVHMSVCRPSHTSTPFAVQLHPLLANGGSGQQRRWPPPTAVPWAHGSPARLHKVPTASIVSYSAFGRRETRPFGCPDSRRCAGPPSQWQSAARPAAVQRTGSSPQPSSLPPPRFDTSPSLAPSTHRCAIRAGRTVEEDRRDVCLQARASPNRRGAVELGRAQAQTN